MGLFDKLFGKKDKSNSIQQEDFNNAVEHAVIIHFSYGIEGLNELHSLEEKLRDIIDNKVGEYDGHEIATDYSNGFLYMYGPNAEILFKAIRPTLDATRFMRGAIAKLRFGPPEEGVNEIEVEL